jgi:copper transport protein
MIALHRGRGHTSVALSTAVAALVAVPSAAAHSVLVATEPEREAVVEESPAHVLLRFNEPVDASLGSPLQVFDGDGNPVGTGPVLRPKASEVSVEFEDDLAEGTYTVAWRVVSADSDAIRGAFVFHVGAPGANPEGVAADVARDSPTSLNVIYRTATFVELALLLLCVGGVSALVYPLASADSRVRRSLHGVLAVAAAGLVVASLVGLATHGAKASGGGLADSLGWSNLSAAADTRFGTAALVRAALAATLLLLALGFRRTDGRSRVAWSIAGAVLAGGIALTPTLSSHARTAGALAVVSDVAHVVAAATWVGALAFVMIALRFALDQRWPLAMQAVPRFSTIAVASVAVLLVAGTVHGYLQVRAWRGLWDTDYGLLLLAKVALILPLLALGAFNNRYVVPRLRAGIAEAGERLRFVRAASTELVVACAIVGVTAFLVDTNPARHALEAEAEAGVMTHGGTGGASSGELDFGDFRAMVSVTPGTAGPNRIELRVMRGRNAPELDAVSFEASLAKPALGPLEFEATSAGVGRWHAEQAEFPIAGEWKLRAEARVGEFELYVDTTEITIGGRSR